jgi:hypothetical protein
MSNDKNSSKQFIIGCILTVALSIFGAWSAGTEKTYQNTNDISVLDEKQDAAKKVSDEKFNQVITLLNSIQSDVSSLKRDVGELKTDVKLIKATKADRKYKD